MKTFKESGDLPATERWTAVKDRCSGMSALWGRSTGGSASAVQGMSPRLLGRRYTEWSNTVYIISAFPR